MAAQGERSSPKKVVSVKVAGSAGVLHPISSAERSEASEAEGR